MLACLIWVGSVLIWVCPLSADGPKLYPLIETRIRFILAAQMLTGDFAVRGNSHAALIPKFIRHANGRGIPVYLVPLARDSQDRLLGLTSCPMANGSRVCIMLIDNGGGGNNQLSTLIHELAHLEHVGKVQTVAEAEVFAETVAFLTLRGLGLDSSAESCSYLFFNSTQAVRQQVLERHEALIYRNVDRLVKVGKG